MKRISLLAALLMSTAPAMAADPDAGATLAEQCAGCHGETGVSVASDIPNLAAQKEGYIAKQLRAFRAGDRTDPLMNAIAAQLDDSEIADLAAHFARLPGAEPEASGAMSAALSGMRPHFPSDYAETFVRYATISFPERKQVRRYYANAAALSAVEAGTPYPDGSYLFVEVFQALLDEDGVPVADENGELTETDLLLFTAMEKSAGWGDEVPGILRNDDWRYAVFSKDGEHRAGVNEGSCLACHKPLDDTDYVFTQDRLASFVQAR